jgi:hypothetical protein
MPFCHAIFASAMTPRRLLSPLMPFTQLIATFSFSLRHYFLDTPTLRRHAAISRHFRRFFFAITGQPLRRLRR